MMWVVRHYSSDKEREKAWTCILVDAFLSLEDGAVVGGGDAGVGGDAATGVHHLQLVLALVLPLQVLDPQTHLQEQPHTSLTTHWLSNTTNTLKDHFY